MTTGSRFVVLALGLSVYFALPAWAEKKPKKAGGSSAQYAVIAGTVFRPPGLALAGAEVEVTPDAEGKTKKLKAVADPRGEFAVRVPAVPMKYKVDVKYSGYKPQQQTVAIEGEQRKDLTFQLELAGK